jgi:uncharacterized surface protein with fasciclin (FAS1) repeats
MGSQAILFHFLQETRMSTKLSRIVLALSTALTLAHMTGCATTETATENAKSTVAPVAAQKVQVNIEELSTFAQLLDQAGLNDTLTQEVTVFAPSNDAFAAVPKATLEKLQKDPAQLKAVLSHHVVNNKLAAAQLGDSQKFTTLNGSPLNVSKAGDYVIVEDGMVTKADLKAGQATIHIIDRVALPPVKK